jgi:phosphohistidine phosphatase
MSEPQRAWLMRHGTAEAERTTDDVRPLTAAGAAAIAAAALGLKALRVQPTAIIHSPYLRTTQTATLVGDVLGVPCRSDEGLTPDADVRVALQRLRAGCMLVSHMPLLPQMAMMRLGHALQFSTGTVAQLRLAGERAELEALWLVEQLAVVGGER